MSYLLDTSVLVRLASTLDPSHGTARDTVARLHRQGESLCVAPQNLIEFRNVATRSASLNGVGLSIAVAEGLATTFESSFQLLPETPDIFPAWKAIVQSLGVIGKQVHDARLVAICHVHNVSHMLTFNTPHFSRFASFGSGLTVVAPGSLAIP